jgi:hypothetical protein
MSGELEAAGALATAGAVAGAIEGREAGKPGEGGCLNCGAALAGPFCSQCGQNAHPHRKLTHVFEEFLHGLLHFDTKAWRTLPMVAFRPGTLTRNYVYGKRARYISPLALFLFCIFLMFFVFAFALPPVDMDAPMQTVRMSSEAQLAEAREELAQAQRDLAEVRASRNPGQPLGLQTRLAESAVNIAAEEVARLEQELAEEQARRAASAAAPAETPEAGAPAAETPAAGAPAGAGAVAPEEAGRTISRSWADALREVAERDDFVVVEGADALNERIRSKFENPELALYKIQQAAYKFSFLLAPMSLPFIAFLFLWKRGVTLYDHMAYALYALSFASLLFIAFVLTAQHAWTNWLPGWLLMVGLPVHTYFHLKGAYALGWFSALWRTSFMLIFALTIMSLFIALIVVLGLTG